MGDFNEKREDPASDPGSANGSYEAFVRRHFHALEKSLTLITLDAGLAADAAQEAFLRLYLRWAEVDKLDDPVAWLYRVGINRCHDYRRQLKRSQRPRPDPSDDHADRHRRVPHIGPDGE